MNGKTERMLAIETKRQAPIEEILDTLYGSEKRSTHAIAKSLGVCQYTVCDWMMKSNIARRSLSAASSNPSPERRMQLSDCHTGIRPKPSSVEKRATAIRGIPRPESVRRKISRSHIGIEHSGDTRKALSSIGREKWRDPEYIRMMIMARQVRPNKLEERVDRILQSNFPGEWGYNGDFNLGVSLGGLIPDFVNTNGRKAVIEVFGNYWHETIVEQKGWRSTEDGRKSVFGELGYDTLILWEGDIAKMSDSEIADVVRRFSLPMEEQSRHRLS